MKNTKLNTLLSTLLITMLFAGTGINAKEMGTDLTILSNDDSTKVYTMVDQMPQIIGGIGEVYKNITYPAKALDNRTEGRVFVQFVVDKNGKVETPKVLKDIGDGCGMAAINALQNVNFTPGMLNGVPVSVSYTLPVTFKMGN